MPTHLIVEDTLHFKYVPASLNPNYIGDIIQHLDTVSNDYMLNIDGEIICGGDKINSKKLIVMFRNSICNADTTREEFICHLEKLNQNIGYEKLSIIHFEDSLKHFLHNNFKILYRESISDNHKCVRNSLDKFKMIVEQLREDIDEEVFSSLFTT